MRGSVSWFNGPSSAIQHPMRGAVKLRESRPPNPPRVPVPSHAMRSRSIPAWAGEPSPARPRSPASRVYPRVGGGARPRISGSWSRLGLSPRGRGSPLALRGACLAPRSIPAWAGEPSRRRVRRCMIRVYPRVGGGATSGRAMGQTAWGLSPRGRGSLDSADGPPEAFGSIPAWAGEPPPFFAAPIAAGVYPRVGGGARKEVRLLLDRVGSIPAWAGEPSPRPPNRASLRVYPRVGGGATGIRIPVESCRGLSPRGRGSRHLPDRRGRGRRSIPAWAGEPS